jgi:hypothetical protein
MFPELFSRFKSAIFTIFSKLKVRDFGLLRCFVVQFVALENPRVGGSIPSSATKISPAYTRCVGGVFYF